MRKKTLLVTILLALSLCSCKVKQKQETSVTPTEVSSTTTMTPQNTTVPITENPGASLTLTQKPTPTPFPTLVPIPDRNSDSIRVALRVPMRLTEEESAEINRILKEEGLSCDVEFIPDTYWYNDHDWERWVNDNEDKLDIIHVGVWNNNSHMRDFMKKFLLPLNNYLETEEGKKLSDAFGEIGWKNAETEEGLIYAVPVLNERQDKKVYMAVNDDYLSLFGSFDFDYESLKTKCDEIDYPNHRIVIDSVSDKIILSLSGYSWIYGGIPYDKTKDKVADTSECLEKIHATCLQLFRDLKDGTIVDESLNQDGAKNPLIYIYYGEEKGIEGYTSFLVNENRYVLGTSGMYGVLASCSRKELALHVLSACFSNPKIAAILCWKNYGEKWENSWDEKAAKWEERVREVKSKPLDEKNRIIPSLSEEELAALDEYTNDLILISLGYYDEKNGSLILNSNYEKDIENRVLWNPNKKMMYMIGVDALNRELETWIIE